MRSPDPSVACHAPASSGLRGTDGTAAPERLRRLHESLFRYVLEATGRHQPLLVVLTVTAFLLEIVPIELQRRIVNDVVKDRQYRLIVALCIIYAAAILIQGGTKLLLNIYRAWVGERATRDLRRRVLSLIETAPAGVIAPEANGIEISMIVAEAEPIGGFVGESISEPLLQGGVLMSMAAYMIHLEPWMTAAALVIFLPQLLFVPLLQNAINRRTASRVRILREVSAGIAGLGRERADEVRADSARIDRVFELNMGIYRVKFSMNFLMNACNHLQIIAALLIGGWFVVTDQLEIGGVVAFISAIMRVNDPWGDLVNYFRDLSNTRIKYRLMADAVNTLAGSELANGGPPGEIARASATG
jgi:ABC-type bacteriocin/lantibiotic exporter with double-glycine peptidase domain